MFFEKFLLKVIFEIGTPCPFHARFQNFSGVMPTCPFAIRENFTKIDRGVLPTLPAHKFLFSFKLVRHSAMSDVVTTNAQTNKIIIVQCMLWMLLQFLYVMYLLRPCYLLFFLRQPFSFCHSLLDSCPAVLTLKAIPL